MEDLQQKVSYLVPLWVKKGLYTKTEFAALLGISRPTLNSRMKNGRWKQKEIDIIIENCPF